MDKTKTSASAPAVSTPAKSSSKTFSISEAIKYGFSFFKKNIVTFIKLGAVLLIINIFTNIITSSFRDTPLNILWGLISLVISILIQLGILKILLDLYDRKPLDLKNLYNQHPLALKFFAASVLYGLMVIVGLIFLVIPGIYIAITYQFYSFLIVDKRVGIIESLKKSSAIAKSAKMNLFLFGLALIGLNILGLILLGVGLLVTIPASMMASVYVYRKLLSQTPGV